MNRLMRKAFVPLLAIACSFCGGSLLASTSSGEAAANKVQTQIHQAAKNVKPAKKAPS
jgi:hypothetical protein